MHVRENVTQPADPSYRLIPLTQGQVTAVDTSDYDRLNQWCWHSYWNRTTKSFYAVRNGNINTDGTKSTIYMARYIMCAVKGELIDHEDHDTLNNRQCNLRRATKQQNAFNIKSNKNTESGIKGVSRNYKNTKWQARIFVGKISVWLGLFDAKEDAANAVKDAYMKHHGEFSSFKAKIPPPADEY